MRDKAPLKGLNQEQAIHYKQTYKSTFKEYVAYL